MRTKDCLNRLSHLGDGLLHELSEGVAGVLAPDVGDELGNDGNDDGDEDNDVDVGDTPDVGDELGNALRVRLGLKLVTLGFQEHFDVLRILQNFHFDIGLIVKDQSQILSRGGLV